MDVGLLHGGERVVLSLPEPVERSSGQRCAEAGREPAVGRTEQEVVVEGVVRAGEDRVPEDRVEQFVPHLDAAERVLERVPGRHAVREVVELVVVHAQRETVLQDLRLDGGQLVALAAVGVDDLESP